MRADGSYVLGDAHGDLVDPEPVGWAVAEYTDEEWRRDMNRERKRRQRERAKRRRT